MRRSPPNRLHLASVALLATLLVATATAPAATSAQEPAVLQGLVVEEGTGRVIEAARVTLIGPGTETTTGPDGVFTFAQAPLGKVIVRVRATGHPAVVEEVEVKPGLLFVPIFLPNAAAVLDELMVTGQKRSEARQNPQAATAADLLALQLPDLSGGQIYVRPRVTPQRMGLRGRGSFGGDGEPTIVLDGAVLKGGLDLLRQIPASQVRNIRILKGPSAGFLYGSADGVVYIQTEAGPPAP